MSEFYDSMAATSLELITEFGQPGAILRPAPGNPTDPDVFDPDLAPGPCQVVMTEFKIAERESSLIREGDRKALVAAQGLSAAPDQSCRLQIGSDVFEIVNVETVSPAGTDLLYRVQVRS